MKAEITNFKIKKPDKTYISLSAQPVALLLHQRISNASKSFDHLVWECFFFSCLCPFFRYEICCRKNSWIIRMSSVSWGSAGGSVIQRSSQIQARGGVVFVVFQSYWPVCRDTPIDLANSSWTSFSFRNSLTRFITPFLSNSITDNFSKFVSYIWLYFMLV